MDFTELSPTFCPYPFVQASSTNRGNARICCRSVGYLERQVEGQKNYAKIDFEKVFNNDYMREVRRNMLAGRPTEACRRCYVEETAGGRSRRQQELKRLNRFPAADQEMVLARVAEARASDGAVSLPPMNYDLHYGNACNSRCRTCWPGASQPFAKEVRELAESGVKLPRHTEEEHLALVADPKFWSEGEKIFDYLRAHPESVRRLQLAGGESLMIDQLFEFIDLFVARGVAGQIDLELVTNMTIFDLELLYKLKHFRRVDLLCSIDGVGQVNEYVRYPARWPKITKNFGNLLALLKDADNVHVFVQATVSNLNLYYVTDLIDWLLAQEMPRKVRMILNHVHTPEFYHIGVMPEALKTRVAARIGAWIARREAEDHASANILDFDEVIARMRMFLEILRPPVEDGEALLRELRSFSRALDVKRAQSSMDILPEMTELFADV